MGSKLLNPVLFVLAASLSLGLGVLFLAPFETRKAEPSTEFTETVPKTSVIEEISTPFDWSVETRVFEFGDGPFAFEDAGVIAFLSEGVLRGLNLKTGEERWETQFGDRIIGAHRANDLVIARTLGTDIGPSAPQQILGVSPDTGKIKWTTELGGLATQFTNDHDGLVTYVGDSSGTLSQIDNTTGNIAWALPPPSNTVSFNGVIEISVSDPLIIATYQSEGHANVVYGVEKDTGHLTWSAQASESGWSVDTGPDWIRPSRTGNRRLSETVFHRGIGCTATNSSNDVICFDTLNGTEIWSAVLGFRTLLAIDDQNIYTETRPAGNKPLEITAFEIGTGNRVWQYTWPETPSADDLALGELGPITGLQYFSSVNGVLVLATHDRAIVLDQLDGNVRWDFQPEEGAVLPGNPYHKPLDFPVLDGLAVIPVEGSDRRIELYELANDTRHDPVLGWPSGTSGQNSSVNIEGNYAIWYDYSGEATIVKRILDRP